MGTNDPEQFLDHVLSRAIHAVRDQGIAIFTFAFYHDHESAAVSICVDTEPNSAHSVHSQNQFSMKYFADAVSKGDLRTAALFRANAGRSLSLGDFEMVNIARTELGDIRPDDGFYLSIIRSVRRREGEITPLAADPRRLLFCSSSADAEVGYMWMAEQVGQVQQRGG